MELLTNPGCTESFCICGHHFLKVDMMSQYMAQAAVLCLPRVYISSCSAVNKSHPIFLIYFGSHYLQVHLHANILNNPIDSPPPPPHSLPSLFSTYWCFGPRPLPYPLRLVLYRVKSGGRASDSWHSAGSLEQKDPDHSYYIEVYHAAALVGNYKLKRGKVNANRQNFDLENSKGNVEASYLLVIDISHFCQEVCIDNRGPAFAMIFFSSMNYTDELWSKTLRKMVFK